MNILTLFLLLCSISLTSARVAVQVATESYPVNACYTPPQQKQNGSVLSDCQVLPDDRVLEANATAVSNIVWKTVIPDLTTLGYEWADYPDNSWLEYDGMHIDVVGVDSFLTNMLIVYVAYNQELDFNPNKVPLRDILLSFWQYKKGNPVSNLEHILYSNVLEENLRNMLPDIYNLLGRNMAEDKQNKAVFQLRASASGNEQIAYTNLLNGCPFPNGAKKMLAEYEEFAGRALSFFEFHWTGGDSFDFAVYFLK